MQLVLEEFFLGRRLLLVGTPFAEDHLSFRFSLLLHVLQRVEELCLEITRLCLLLLLPECPRLFLLQVQDHSHALIRHFFDPFQAQASAVLVDIL